MKFLPLAYERLAPEAMVERAQAFAQEMGRRRSVREFLPDPVPEGVLEEALRAAGAAPSGANLQPWHFAVVRDPGVKHRIRVAAEAEEHTFYEGRAPKEWLRVLTPLGTDATKPFLETAPVLIAIFQQNQVMGSDGRLQRTYYPKESVGIATGLLIATLHRAGLATLTHTPSPMAFLNNILERPRSEKPFLLLVVGYPTPDCTVPDLARKPLDAIVSWH